MASTIYPTVSWMHGIALDHLASRRTHGGLAIWHVADGDSVVPCAIPFADLAMRLRAQPLVANSFQMACWPDQRADEEAPLPILTAAIVDPDPDHPLRFMPADLSPVRGLVDDTLGLVRRIEAEPMRKMVERVFLKREVARRYWTMPAGRRHHHAFAGGLALHSLEVAKDLEGQAALASHERDICIAAGLLHDIGKVWAYDDEMRLTDEAKAVGHERIGLRRLHDELDLLECEWPDGAHAMAVLLDGSTRRRPDGSLPSALVARLKAADQRSSERERRGRNEGESWCPEPYKRIPGLRLVTAQSSAEPF